MPETAKVSGAPTAAGSDPPRALDRAKETTLLISKEMTLLEEASYRVVYLVTGRSEGAEALKDPDPPPDGVIPSFLTAQRTIHSRISALLNSMNDLIGDL